jgi:hypothetical protein
MRRRHGIAHQLVQLVALMVATLLFLVGWPLAMGLWHLNRWGGQQITRLLRWTFRR